MCDEAVSALDVSVQAQILNLLSELQQRHAMAYLFISHDLNVVRYMADYVAVMFAGRIVEQGDAQTLLTHSAHPYTQALVASSPAVAGAVPTASIDAQFVEPGWLSGEVPMSTSSGCAFYSRCGYAQPRCSTETPSTTLLANGVEVMCHLYT